MTMTISTETDKDSAFQKLKTHRRFDRFARLIGESQFHILKNSHIMIIGCGGVGSWAAESLARSGVGRISLVDFDEVCITNTNRQLPALSNTIGQKKVEILKERLLKINPLAELVSHIRFHNSETSEDLLSHNPDLVLDCIDNITAKCHLIASCLKKKIKVISSGGAGSRMNPLAIEVKDFFETHTDQFLQQVRKELRAGYPDLKLEKLGVPCVFSSEKPSVPHSLTYDKGGEFQCVCPQGQNDYHSCERRNIIHGTASFVTGTFGLVMASEAIKTLTDANHKSASTVY